MTLSFPALFSSAALLLLVGCAITTSAAPMASAGPSKAQITILYDAFGKDSAMQKMGYAALVEYGGEAESCSTPADEPGGPCPERRRQKTPRPVEPGFRCHVAPPRRSRGRIGVPVEGEPQSEDLRAEGGVWRLWRRPVRAAFFARTLLYRRNSAYYWAVRPPMSCGLDQPGLAQTSNSWMKQSRSLPTPRVFDGAAEAKLIALTCSPAPEGFARWSLRLLEEKVVELNIVEKASDNTIGRLLKKTRSNPIAGGNG